MSNTLLIDRKATHKYIIATYTHHRQITCKLAGQLVCHSGSSHVGDVMLSYTSVNCKLRVDVDWHAKDSLVKVYECCYTWVIPQLTSQLFIVHFHYNFLISAHIFGYT